MTGRHSFSLQLDVIHAVVPKGAVGTTVNVRLVTLRAPSAPSSG